MRFVYINPLFLACWLMIFPVLFILFLWNWIMIVMSVIVPLGKQRLLLSILICLLKRRSRILMSIGLHSFWFVMGLARILFVCRVLLHTNVQCWVHIFLKSYELLLSLMLFLLIDIFSEPNLQILHILNKQKSTWNFRQPLKQG